MPMNPALKSSWIDALRHGSAVVDGEGNILELRVNGQPVEGMGGVSLRDELVRHEPSWEEQIPELADPSAFPVHLFYNHLLYGLNKGILIDRQVAGDFVILTLQPTLGDLRQGEDGSAESLIRNPEVLGAFYREYRTVQSRLNHFMHHFPGVYFSQKPDLSFQFISDRVSEWLGIPAENFYRSTNTFLDLVHHEDRKPFLQKLKAHARSDDSLIFKYRIGPLPDGRILFVQDSRKAVCTESGILVGYEGLWLDITSQAMAEDRLMSVSWKENVSLITSGLAHDFRNIISGIYSLAELVSDIAGEDAPHRESLLHIKDYSQKALKLVHRIVELNRSEPGTEDLHNLDSLVCEQAELLRAYLPRNIKLQLDTDGAEIPVFLDKVEFERALLNLAINARDALADQRGAIVLRSRAVRAGETIFEQTRGGPIPAPADGGLIEFSDNGKGIHASVLDRIFDAFFTTKEAHKGSGLGLYSVLRFIRQSEGRIDLASEVNAGTTFSIFLPQHDFSETQEAEDFDPSPEPAAPAGPARVQRTRLVFFGRGALEELDIVAILREREVEVICLESIRQVLYFLEETESLPQAIVHHCPLNLDEEREQVVSIKRLFPQTALMIHHAEGTGFLKFQPDDDLADFIIKPSLTPIEKVREILQFLK